MSTHSKRGTMPATDERSRDSSDPPPPMPGNANSVDVSRSRADHAVDKARLAMASADDAADDAAKALSTARAIEEKIGNSPDPALGVPGRGLIGVVSGIVADVHKIGVKVDGLITGMEKAAVDRRSLSERIVTMIAGPVIAVAVAALSAYLAGFHR